MITLAGRTVTGLGAVKQAWASDGTASFTFGLRPTTPVQTGDRCTVALAGDVLFDGAVRSVRREERQGLVLVSALDWKGWLQDLPFMGRSLQFSRTARKARVRYPFTSTGVSAGWLVPWTVGAMIADILNNAYGAMGSPADDLPCLTDVLPAAVAAACVFDRTNWLADNFTTISTWVSGVTGGSSTSPWAALTLKPWTHQHDADSVFAAIAGVMRKYYPAQGWWYNPATARLEPFATYDEDADEYRIGRTRRLYLDGVDPVVNGCYTRVIVEGQHAVEGSPPSDYLLSAFLGQGPFDPSETLAVQYRVTGGNTVEHQDTRTYVDGMNADNQAAVKRTTTTGWQYAYPGETPPDGANYTIQAGKCWSDTRYRYDTGWGGTAYTDLGLRRTLLLVDDTLGDAVYTTASNGAGTTVDRSAEQAALAEGVWAMLRDTRYTGRLVVPGTPAGFCPLRRVTVRNHPALGDLTFAPHGVEWDYHTGMLTYTLGDSRFNPIEQLRLLRALKERDGSADRVRGSVVR